MLVKIHNIESLILTLCFYLVSVWQNGCILLKEIFQNFRISSVQFSQFISKAVVTILDLLSSQWMAAGFASLQYTKKVDFKR